MTNLDHKYSVEIKQANYISIKWTKKIGDT